MKLQKNNYVGWTTMYHSGPNSPMLIVEKDNVEIFRKVAPDIRKKAYGLWATRTFYNVIRGSMPQK